MVKPLDGYELSMQDEEITMLTELIAKSIANKHKELKDFLNFKEECDFICIDFNSDKFLSLMLNDKQYLHEFLKVLVNILGFMKHIGRRLDLNVWIRIKRYNIKDNYLHIKFNTDDDRKIKHVRIHLYDIMWGILMFKNKPLFQIIFDEIMVAPFI